MDEKHQIELPIDRIEEALIQCAIPGFWGELTITIDVQPTAALEVAFHAERKTISQKDTVREELGIAPTNERVYKVRNKISEIRSRFVLECKVSAVRAIFKDGQLVHCELIECTKLPAPVRLPVRMS